MVIKRFESPTICCLSRRKGKTMRKRRSNKRTHKNLYAEKSLLLERKNLNHPLKYKKDSLSINKTTPKSKSTVEFRSRKSNELTKITKQQIHIAGKFCSTSLNGATLKTPSRMSSRRALRSTSRLKTTLNPKEGTVADKIKTRLKSEKQQNIVEKKALHISQTELLKSQNKSKGQNGLHCNKIVGVSRFPQGSPNKPTRSSRSSIRLQSHEFLKNNSENVQPSVSPKFRKQQDILNVKTPCIPKKIWPRSSSTIKRLERQNEVHHNTVINVSGFINESPNETARSSRRSIRSQSQEFLKNKSDNVQLSKLSVSPEFKKQKNILNEKTPCMPKKLRRKSSNKMKELQEQNEVHHNTVINVSRFINESPNETARSPRRSMRSQSQEFLKNKSDSVQLSELSVSPKFKQQQNISNEKTPCMPKKLRRKSSNRMKELQEQNEVHHNTVINVSRFINESPNETARSPRRSMRSQSQEFLKNKSDSVQLSELSVSPKFKQQQNISNEKTPCMPKKLRRKSSNKMKELQEQNEVHHNTVINVSGFINESPSQTARSSRRSMISQSQEFLKDKSNNVQLSELSVSPKFKQQQNILNEKTPCMPKKLRRKSSNKMKELQEQNEVHHNTVINVSGFINESPSQTARSSRRSMISQSQEFLKDKSNNVQLSELSVSPKFKQQQNILNEKTPCMPKKLRKSSNKMKELQEQNEVHHNAVINVSGFINESPNETARSSRKRKGLRSQSQEFLSKEHDIVQLSKLSVSPEFKKQRNILNEKTPCVPKKLRQKSSSKAKDLEGQNEVHYKTAINESGFINESPNETARSSRRSLRSQSQEFFKNKSDNVHLSKLSVSPELKKQQNILSDKTPMPKKLRLKSSDKIKELQEQNELHKATVNVSEFINESPNETARSSRKSKRLQPSKHLRNSTKQQKVKQLITPNRKSNKHSSFAQKNMPIIKKRYVQKSSEKLQKRVRPNSCVNIPVDDLALSPFIQRQTKSDGFKLPGKNTLKRKRFILERMKKADEEYEDDIYEERQFTNFINMLPEETSDSELSYSMSTPKLGFTLTPQIRSKTPVYKDCFSPTQYALSRKIAEECFYRNKKRKSKSEPEIPAVPEKKKIDFDEILENACKVQKEVEKLAVEESDCDDNYFTDEEK